MDDFDDYKDAFETIRLERSANGILQVELHSAGGPYIWDARQGTGVPQKEIGVAFQRIARDRDNRVVIITGTGDEFSGPKATSATRSMGDARHWEFNQTHGVHMIMDLLDIPVPVIGCLNGPAYRHAEIPFTADIVLAADHATIQDSAHFTNRMVPGDGIALIFPFLMGWNRGRYFHLMGQTLTAPELKEMGLVNEVMPRGQLLPRAWEIAEELVKNNPLVLRYTRKVFTGPLKALVSQYLDLGLALEALAAVDEAKHLEQ